MHWIKAHCLRKKKMHTSLHTYRRKHTHCKRSMWEKGHHTKLVPTKLNVSPLLVLLDTLCHWRSLSFTSHQKWPTLTAKEWLWLFCCCKGANKFTNTPGKPAWTYSMTLHSQHPKSAQTLDSEHRLKAVSREARMVCVNPSGHLFLQTLREGGKAMWPPRAFKLKGCAGQAWRLHWCKPRQCGYISTERSGGSPAPGHRPPDRQTHIHYSSEMLIKSFRIRSTVTLGGAKGKSRQA